MYEPEVGDHIAFENVTGTVVAVRPEIYLSYDKGLVFRLDPGQTHALAGHHYEGREVWCHIAHCTPYDPFPFDLD